MDADIIKEDFFDVGVRDDVNRVMGWLRGDRDEVPIITDTDGPLGILNVRGMLQSRIDGEEKLEAYLIGTRCLPVDGDLGQAVDLVLTSGLPYLPVVDHDGELEGYVDSRDLALEVLHRAQGNQELDLQPQALATEVDPPLRTDTTLGEAIHRFQGTTLPELPVVGGRTGDLEGVMERREAVQAELLGEHEAGGRGDRNDIGQSESRSDLPVEGLMTTHYATVHVNAEHPEVEEALGDFGYGVVVENESPWGMLTPITLLRALRGNSQTPGSRGAPRTSPTHGS